MSSSTFRTHRRRWLTGLAGAAALVIAFPATAFAAPPPALPANADALDRTYPVSYTHLTLPTN